MRFPLALVFLVPAFVAAFPAVMPTMRSDKDNPDSRTMLYPRRHPDDDPGELANLKATTSATLYYEADSAHALVHIPAFNHPAVSLERTDFVSSVTCNGAGNTMVVTFKDDKSWETASTDWTHHGAFFIISHVEGCGGQGGTSEERDFHLVSSIRPLRSKKQIFCRVARVEVEQAAHPDHVIEFQVRKYSPSPAASFARRGIPGIVVHRPIILNGHEKEELEKLFKKAGEVARKTGARILKGEIPLVALVKELVAPTSDASYTLDSSAGWVTTPFGPGYVILPLFSVSKTTKQIQTGRKDRGAISFGGRDVGSLSVGGKVGVWCVRCGVTSTKTGYTLSGTMSSSKTLLSAKTNVTGDLTVVVGVGAEITGKLELKFELPLIKIPIPSPVTLYLPGFLEIGPDVEIALGISIKGEASGKLFAGTKCKFSKVSYTLDLLDRSAGSLDHAAWTPVCTPDPLQNSLTLSITVSPYLKLSLAFNIKALSSITKLASLSTALAAQASLDFIASVLGEADPNCGFDVGAFKYSVELAFAFSVQATISTLYEGEYEVWKPTPYVLLGNCKKPVAREVMRLDSGLEGRQDSDDGSNGSESDANGGGEGDSQGDSSDGNSEDSGSSSNSDDTSGDSGGGDSEQGGSQSDTSNGNNEDPGSSSSSDDTSGSAGNGDSDAGGGDDSEQGGDSFDGNNGSSSNSDDTSGSTGTDDSDAGEGGDSEQGGSQGDTSNGNNEDSGSSSSSDDTSGSTGTGDSDAGGRGDSDQGDSGGESSSDNNGSSSSSDDTSGSSGTDDSDAGGDSSDGNNEDSGSSSSSGDTSGTTGTGDSDAGEGDDSDQGDSRGENSSEGGEDQTISGAILWDTENQALVIGEGGALSFSASDGTYPWSIDDGLIFLNSDTSLILSADDGLLSSGMGKPYMADSTNADTKKALTFAPAEDFMLVVNSGSTVVYYPIACSMGNRQGFFLIADTFTDADALTKLAKDQGAKKCVFVELRQTADPAGEDGNSGGTSDSGEGTSTTGDDGSGSGDSGDGSSTSEGDGSSGGDSDSGGGTSTTDDDGSGGSSSGDGGSTGGEGSDGSDSGDGGSTGGEDGSGGSDSGDGTSTSGEDGNSDSGDETSTTGDDGSSGTSDSGGGTSTTGDDGSGGGDSGDGGSTGGEDGSSGTSASGEGTSTTGDDGSGDGDSGDGGSTGGEDGSGGTSDSGDGTSTSGEDGNGGTSDSGDGTSTSDADGSDGNSDLEDRA